MAINVAEQSFSVEPPTSQSAGAQWKVTKQPVTPKGTALISLIPDSNTTDSVGVVFPVDGNGTMYIKGVRFIARSQGIAGLPLIITQAENSTATLPPFGLTVRFYG